jgi:hypothetical protein
VTPRIWHAAGIAAGLVVGAAQAADDRGLHGAVGLDVQYSNNLFSLPAGVTPAQAGVSAEPGDDGSHRNDTTVSPFVSLNARMALGRQRLGVSLTRRETSLQRYQGYDSSTGDMRATWDWQLGNEFDGRVDLGSNEQATELRDFLSTRRNLLTIRNEQVSANWRPRPDRRVSVELRRYHGSNDQPARASADYDIDIWSLEGGWVTALSTELTLRWRHTDGNYPNRSISATTPIDNSYQQDDGDVGIVWRPGGSTRAEARLGYATRQHDEVPQRDFDGPSGRVAVVWQATGALSLNADAVRDLNAIDDFDRLFAISTSTALGARWVHSAQWQLALRWSMQRIAFGGDPQNVLTQVFGQAPERRDRVRSERLALTWLPLPRLQLEFSLDHVVRHSNRPALTFGSKQAGFSTRYAF